MESRLVGKGIEDVKMGDKVKVSFQETHDPGIKLPVFELVSRRLSLLASVVGRR